ncbi:MAG: hypothetical protein AAGJ46_13425 [Planctomycetota bacterium]
MKFHSALAAVALLASSMAANTHAATVSLAGGNADGYLAIVGFNQEGNTTLDAISRDPTDAKFFDYPAYVNPTNAANIFIMSVEPYRFGLTYPDPLHLPIGGGALESVGTLQPAGTPGATFIEAVTEDADFAETDIGGLDFNPSVLSAVGVEVVPPTALSFNLNSSEFQSTNRTDLTSTPSDTPPFGPSGRTNFNEFANNPEIVASNPTGTGLTFVDGVLTSIDLTVDVVVNTRQVGFGGAGFNGAAGSLTFSGNSFAFDVDDVVGGFFASRILLNRSGTVDAVGALTVPEPTSVTFALLVTAATASRRRRKAA